MPPGASFLTPTQEVTVQPVACGGRISCDPCATSHECMSPRFARRRHNGLLAGALFMGSRSKKGETQTRRDPARRLSVAPNPKVWAGYRSQGTKAKSYRHNTCAIDVADVRCA